MFGHKQIVTIIDLIEELRTKAVWQPKTLPRRCRGQPAHRGVPQEVFTPNSRKRKQTSRQAGTRRRHQGTEGARSSPSICPEGKETEYTPEQVSAAFDALEERVVRDLILEGKRIDGRTTKQTAADLPAKSACCRACTARRCSSAAKRRRWSSTTLGTSQRRAARRRPGRRIQQEVHARLQLPAVLRRRMPAASAAPAGARSATAPWPNAA